MSEKGNCYVVCFTLDENGFNIVTGGLTESDSRTAAEDVTRALQAIGVRGYGDEKAAMVRDEMLALVKSAIVEMEECPDEMIDEDDPVIH